MCNTMYLACGGIKSIFMTYDLADELSYLRACFVRGQLSE
jgi:hypothetical protein